MDSRPSTRPPVLQVGLLSVLLLLPPACSAPTWITGRQPPDLMTPSAAADLSLGSGAGRTAPHGRSAEIVHLVFDVVRVDLPIGTIRHSAKVWNHVDELRGDLDQVPRLARNGLRVGACSNESWPAIRAIVAAAEGEMHKEQMTPPWGKPLLVRLGEVRKDSAESIFSYQEGGRLAGKTFSAGEKLFVLDYALRSTVRGPIDLAAGLEVRHDLGAMTWERRGGVVLQVPEVNRFLFTSATAQLALNEGEFLVIGPSEKAVNPYLVGSRFLISSRAGTAIETILCITPRVVRTRRPVSDPSTVDANATSRSG